MEKHSFEREAMKKYFKYMNNYLTEPAKSALTYVTALVLIALIIAFASMFWYFMKAVFAGSVIALIGSTVHAIFAVIVYGAVVGVLLFLLWGIIEFIVRTIMFIVSDIKNKKKNKNKENL